MLYTKRQSTSRLLTGNALGSSVSFEITRDFFLDSLIIEISGTITTGADAISADGILGLVKQITLATADGASNRNVVQVSGATAIVNGFYVSKGIDQATLNTYLLGNVTGTFIIRYPIFFAEPRLMDPAASAFLLPLPRYNANPVLTIQFASQTDIDIDSTPAFAISAGISARVIYNKRQVDNINLSTFETEFIESQRLYTAVEPNANYDLQVPGSYFLFGIRGFTSAAAWGDISSAAGITKLQLLGNVLRTCYFSDIALENQLATQDNWAATTTHAQRYGLFPGVAIFDFLSDRWSGDAMECSSALNTNLLAGSGSNVQYQQDVSGGTNVKNVFFWKRVFGDLSGLQMK